MTIRALIVDDEEPGRVNLRCALAEHAGWLVVAECASASAAREALAAQEVDVIFLDIQMPGESGMALAATLAKSPNPPLIIFVTAHSSFGVDAFEVHALDYLLKPINDARLADAVTRAAAMLDQRQRAAYGQAIRAYVADEGQYLRQLSVKSVGRVDCVQLADVQWIEACGNYVQLHLGPRRLMHRAPIGKLAQRLDPEAFMQVHRGAIVRVEQFSSLEVVADGSYRLNLRCGATVPVSERYIDQLRARID
ncbi:LytTR family DNA-binding domain-containing protein [Massilia sp. CF038]|uniref:LytR/AlgR family response regulator transcription factor n=1 Tax=Massilia sp. CF038 TaxID=1881045 RepID=UPI0009147914|nr:LytTR family DNA-binding domain-containing protein [Massilia sp. CF038]SHH61908.1 two component transcriptional regulator, LytTR family [Massilia sp. CF038]